MEALEDETVKLHAIFALGNIGTARAIPKLEPFLTDKVSGCRKEAQKAIRKIKSKFK
jgi:HEAT repeat protein